MRQVLKFDLHIAVDNYFEVPKGYLPTHVGQQENQIKLWIEVPLKDELKKRIKVRVFGTGHTISDNDFRYLGTVQMPTGLVWHVYYDPLDGLD